MEMAEETGLEEDWNSLWRSMTKTLIAEGQRCGPLWCVCVCVCVCVFAWVQYVAVSLFIFSTILLIIQLRENQFYDCVFPDLPVSWFWACVCACVCVCVCVASVCAVRENQTISFSSSGKLLFGGLPCKHTYTIPIHYTYIPASSVSFHTLSSTNNEKKNVQHD